MHQHESIWLFSSSHLNLVLNVESPICRPPSSLLIRVLRGDFLIYLASSSVMSFVQSMESLMWQTPYPYLCVVSGEYTCLVFPSRLILFWTRIALCTEVLSLFLLVCWTRRVNSIQQTLGAPFVPCSAPFSLCIFVLLTLASLFLLSLYWVLSIKRDSFHTVLYSDFANNISPRHSVDMIRSTFEMHMAVLHQIAVSLIVQDIFHGSHHLRLCDAWLTVSLMAKDVVSSLTPFEVNRWGGAYALDGGGCPVRHGSFKAAAFDARDKYNAPDIMDVWWSAGCSAGQEHDSLHDPQLFRVDHWDLRFRMTCVDDFLFLQLIIMSLRFNAAEDGTHHRMLWEEAIFFFACSAVLGQDHCEWLSSLVLNHDSSWDREDEQKCFILCQDWNQPQQYRTVRVINGSKCFPLLIAVQSVLFDFLVNIYWIQTPIHPFGGRSDHQAWRADPAGLWSRCQGSFSSPSKESSSEIIRVHQKVQSSKSLNSWISVWLVVDYNAGRSSNRTQKPKWLCWVWIFA